MLRLNHEHHQSKSGVDKVIGQAGKINRDQFNRSATQTILCFFKTVVAGHTTINYRGICDKF